MYLLLYAYFFINFLCFSIVNSIAKLTVVRKPLEGTYGQISVQYRIEKADLSVSTSENANDPVNDLYPVEGYIVINDGVDHEV